MILEDCRMEYLWFVAPKRPEARRFARSVLENSQAFAKDHSMLHGTIFTCCHIQFAFKRFYGAVIK